MLNKNRHGSNLMLGGEDVVERSHSVHPNNINNSNISSFAAAKQKNNDKTNNSQNLLGWVDDTPVGGGRSKSVKRKGKAKAGDADMLDFVEIKAQQNRNARKSIFIPKKANLRKSKDIDYTDDKQGPGASDDEDDSASDINKSASSRYNLKAYNRDRKQRLNEFDFTTVPVEEEEDDDFDKQVMSANKLKLNCFGNLEISLFWEEKFALLIRVAQLYSVLLFFYYEQWPSNTRKLMTEYFAGAIGAAGYIRSQEDFYAFMQDLKLLEYVVAATFLANVLLVIIGLVLTCKKTLRYRLEFVYDSCCNIYRFYFWMMEILFIPLLINVSWPASCKFWTERDAVYFIDCKEDGDLYYWALKGIMAGSYLLALLYNLQLFSYIYGNKISTAFHEQAVQKKEVEYSYGINKIWSSEKFFTFSSFKGGVGSIYHRIVFNLFCVCFIAINAIPNEGNIDDQKMTISIHTILVIVFTVHVIMTRPYRNFSSNLLYILCMLAFTTMMVMMYMKVQGYEQSIFVDKYFFLLTIFMSGFLWFLVLMSILFTLFTCQKWGLDKEIVMELTEGQDLAIYYIKDARTFIVHLLNKKKYGENEAFRMEQLIENLTMQFNNFRGTQPLIMDSLLETIDSLRLLQRNYEQDPELFNFDYKDDLLIMARERERVFSLSKFQSQQETDVDETKASNFTSIYGMPASSPFGNNDVATGNDSDDSDEYVQPARSKYPEAAVYKNFGDMEMADRRKVNNADDIEMEFN